MNKKEMKRNYFRILKFMLIGIIPNLFLYFFLFDKLPEWLITILSILIFVACGFIGEAIYNHIKNKQIMNELIKDQEKKQKKEGNN